jgi:hypothetical protein
LTPHGIAAIIRAVSPRSSNFRPEVDMAVGSESAKTPESVASGGATVVVDLGRKPKKQVKQLREGRGKLLDEVNIVLAELRTNGSISSSAQPVVVVVRERPKARGLFWPAL